MAAFDGQLTVHSGTVGWNFPNHFVEGRNKGHNLERVVPLVVLKVQALFLSSWFLYFRRRNSS